MNCKTKSNRIYASMHLCRMFCCVDWTTSTAIFTKLEYSISMCAGMKSIDVDYRIHRHERLHFALIRQWNRTFSCVNWLHPKILFIARRTADGNDGAHMCTVYTANLTVSHTKLRNDFLPMKFCHVTTPGKVKATNATPIVNDKRTDWEIKKRLCLSPIVSFRACRVPSQLTQLEY